MFTSYYKSVQGGLELIQEYEQASLQDEASLTSLSAARRTFSPTKHGDENHLPHDGLLPARLPSSHIIPENAVFAFSKEEMAEWASMHREPSPLPPEKESRSSSLMVEIGKRVTGFKRKRSPSPDVPRSHPCQDPPGRYKGFILIENRDEAKRFAQMTAMLPCRSAKVNRIVLWTDGSVVKNCGAGSVVWKRPPDYEVWDGQGFPLQYKTNSSTLTELFAISHALEIAVDQVKELQGLASQAFRDEGHDVQIQPGYRVFVFTDSSGALGVMQHGRPKRRASGELWDDYIHKCVKHHDELRRLGADVQLRLVPGHNGVPGNEEAHRLASTTARSVAIDRGVNRGLSARRIKDIFQLMDRRLRWTFRGSQEVLSQEGLSRDEMVRRISATDVHYAASSACPRYSADNGSMTQDLGRKDPKWHRLLHSLTPHRSLPAPPATVIPSADRDADEWVADPQETLPLPPLDPLLGWIPANAQQNAFDETMAAETLNPILPEPLIIVIDSDSSTSVNI